uniref:Alpha-macroglobulin receptor-binding domain-containing protein n=1 Tax=Erpetoichthys calabaricus TaxID=27687 RepID=A0A8C4XC61_ERPCA
MKAENMQIMFGTTKYFFIILQDSILNNSLSCLRSSLSNVTDVYTKILLSYMFTLARDEEARNSLLSFLDKVAAKEDGFLHWERSGSGEKINSVQVEMTSYVLLSLFSGPPLPQFDLTYASSIVQWLVRQQNSYGGFSSTQDTVVALQSLALYAAQTYKPDGSSTVTISSSQGFQAQFQLDQSNRLLYQERTLPEIPGTYSVQAEGDVCSFVQVSVFNLLHIFSFVIFVLIFCCVRTCTFLLCFFQLVQRKPLTLHFTIQEEIAVKNLKPATVRIYDYYQTNDHAEAEYRSPCTTGIVFFNISVCLIRLFSNNSINFTF